MILQVIEKRYTDAVETALKYYDFLVHLNNLPITPGEVQLMAFIAVRGNINSGGAKEAFMARFGSSRATIGNMVYMLTGKGVLQREGRKLTLHPSFSLDFTQDIVIKLTLLHGLK